MSLIYLTEVSLFFSIFTEHIETFGPSCHMLKSPTAAEIRHLHLKPFTNCHLKPFTNCHFHYFIMMDCARMEPVHHCAWVLTLKNNDTWAE
jgi:hypothetical protein